MEDAVAHNNTRIIDIDLNAYFDNVSHDILLKKVTERVNDDKVMRLLKLILKASGKRGVTQGGVNTPFLSNIYFNEIDKMLERAKQITKRDRYKYVEYVRFADDVVILADGFRVSDFWDYNCLVKATFSECSLGKGVEIYQAYFK